MSRWIKHWLALPVRNRVGAAVSLAALIVMIVRLAFQIKDLVAGLDEAAPTPALGDPAAVLGWPVEEISSLQSFGRQESPKR